jgi:chromosome segregation ATPase
MTKSTDPAQRMKELRAEAIAAVTAALWENESADEIAKTALQGGLTPADVDRIAVMVKGAQAKLDALADYDVVKLKAVAAGAHAAFTEAEAAADKAIEKSERCADALSEAQAKMQQAKQVCETAATAFQRDEIPIERVPEIVTRIIKAREADDRVTQIDGQISQAKSDVRRLQPSLEALEKRFKELDKTNEGKEAVIPRPGGLVDERKAVRAQLTTLKKHLADIGKAQAAALAELPKAQAAAQAARSAIGY